MNHICAGDVSSLFTLLLSLSIWFIIFQAHFCEAVIGPMGQGTNKAEDIVSNIKHLFWDPPPTF